VTVTIDRLALSGENSILFRDLDVKPPLTLEVDSLQMQLSEVDTSPASGHAGVALQAGMGKYTSLNVTGDVSAPWKDPDLDVDVKLSTLDLPSLTPYADRHMGYILKSGHLNTDLEIIVKNGKLDVQSEIVVNRIDMDPIREKDEQRASERLGIPINTALSLLKDKNDDIRLSIPVQGDLNDPEFDISDVLLSVTGNALKRGVSSYYKSLGVTILTGAVLPPGTFSVLGKVFKATTAVSFDPVIFQPLETGLSHEDEVFLDQLAQKLAEKPGTRLILCGKVTRPDIGALRERDFAAFQALDPSAGSGTAPADAPGTAGSQAAEVGSSVADTSLQAPPSGPPSIEEVPLAEDEQGQLIELAKQRAMAVKDYLIEAGGLDPKRLFVCYSDVELEEGGPPPRVDLSI
jgi:hypothetical protein